MVRIKVFPPVLRQGCYVFELRYEYWKWEKGKLGDITMIELFVCSQYGNSTSKSKFNLNTQSLHKRPSQATYKKENKFAAPRGKNSKEGPEAQNRSHLVLPKENCNYLAGNNHKTRK